jgi:hypothetical protein
VLSRWGGRKGKPLLLRGVHLPPRPLFGEVRDGLLLRAKQHKRLILRVWELAGSMVSFVWPVIA